MMNQDPVNGSPAVLVKRYNITQQKETEMQLSMQQEALQRWGLHPAHQAHLVPSVMVLLYCAVLSC